MISKSKYIETINKTERDATILQQNLKDNIYEKLKFKIDGMDDRRVKASKLLDKQCHDHDDGHSKSYILVYGFIHRVDLFEIQDFDIFVDLKDGKSVKDKDSLFNEHEIKQAKSLLESSLKMLSVENTCRMVNFDSN